MTEFIVIVYRFGLLNYKTREIKYFSIFPQETAFSLTNEQLFFGCDKVVSECVVSESDVGKMIITATMTLRETHGFLSLSVPKYFDCSITAGGRSERMF